MRDHVASSAAAASALVSVGFPRLQSRLHRTVDAPQLSTQTVLSSTLVPGVGPLPAQGGMAKGDVSIAQHLMSSGLVGASASAAATTATTGADASTAATVGGASGAGTLSRFQRLRQKKRQALGDTAYKADEARKRRDRKR